MSENQNIFPLHEHDDLINAIVAGIKDRFRRFGLSLVDTGEIEIRKELHERLNKFGSNPLRHLGGENLF